MFKEKIKSLISNKMKGDNKKNIENLIVFLVLLIVTIIAINLIWGGEKEKQDTTTNGNRILADTNLSTSSTNSENGEYNLQDQLEDILQKIEGVGNVKVLITYSETSKIVPIYNENNSTSITEETDSTGGKRTIEVEDTSKEVIFEEDNGESSVITEKIIMPTIEGAIIIAQGGNDPVIKTSIVQAVSAVTGLASYKVQVFAMSE